MPESVKLAVPAADRVVVASVVEPFTSRAVPVGLAVPEAGLTVALTVAAVP